MARISTRSYRERVRSRFGNKLSQVHSRPTSSYSGGRSGKSSRDGVFPRITELIRRNVNGSDTRAIGRQKCWKILSAIFRSEHTPLVVGQIGSATAHAK